MTEPAGLAALIDVETTGIGPAHEIVELGLILFRFEPISHAIGEVVDTYNGLREPGCPITYGAQQVHGLSMAMVRGHVLDHRRVDDLIRSASVLIAHNAPFDRSFVAPMFDAARTKSWLCSMNGINWKAKGFASRGLQYLLKAHHIEAGHAHRAEDDARATYRLLSCVQEDGTTYFSELMKNGSRKSARRPVQKA